MHIISYISNSKSRFIITQAILNIAASAVEKNVCVVKEFTGEWNLDNISNIYRRIVFTGKRKDTVSLDAAYDLVNDYEVVYIREFMLDLGFANMISNLLELGCHGLSNLKSFSTSSRSSPTQNTENKNGESLMMEVDKITETKVGTETLQCNIAVFNIGCWLMYDANFKSQLKMWSAITKLVVSQSLIKPTNLYI